MAEVTDADAKGSFMARMNPLNLLKKDTPEALVKEGRALMERGNYNQAALSFQRALEKDPKFAGALLAQADMLLKKGGNQNLKLAITHLQRAAALTPLDDHIYRTTAKIYRSLNMLKEEQLEMKKLVVVKTLATDPHNAIANNNMGVLFLQQDLANEAMAYFNRAIIGNAKYDVAYRNIGLTYMKMHADGTGPTAKTEAPPDLLEKAKTNLDKALALHTSAGNLVARARLHMTEQQFEPALALCEKASHLDAANKEALMIIKAIHIKFGRLEEAQQAGSMLTAIHSTEHK